MTMWSRTRACADSCRRVTVRHRAADKAIRIWRRWPRNPVGTSFPKIRRRNRKIVGPASNRIMRCLLMIIAGASRALAQTDTRVPVVENPNAHEKFGFIRSPYQAKGVNPFDQQNSARIYDLMRAGNIYLSLADAVALAIENN